ncbi:hypothetical protein N7468_004700 [Penicillium chermesinum]|uniref:Phosphatidylinositol N-acetylglucosaminyltransferase subunit H conserved domain-containing protein n=1 Tax=Penicillium chermesinum TaxID=63820 RepID=A0A9W9TSU0_9EURO|nr:uncharacterized protein N7468_004700 [Penicillium chermesinum]KAJ5240081.1 hypothetical protein N7468_004700 [Penicillium chermesinum]KAJ6166956.1 hypothetical protein N7470_002403 [Penicillium chermesinum]
MACRLCVRRPSPTTVSFTVSNAPRRANTPAKILFGLQILLRAFLLLCVITIGAVQLEKNFPEIDRWAPSLQPLWSQLDQTYLCNLVDKNNPWIVAAICVIVVYGVFRRGYTEESLLVIRGFGIQTSTSSSTYLSTASTRFIPTTQIQDIVIHEAFKGFEVRFYLAVIVEGEPQVLVVFPQLLPKRDILEEVWRGSRRCLYDAKS